MSATLSSEIIEVRFSTQAAIQGAVDELRSKLAAKCPREYAHHVKLYYDGSGGLLAHIFAGDHSEELVGRIVRILAQYDQGSEVQVLRPSS